MKGGASPRFDIAALRDTLRAGAASPSWLSSWLAESSAEPTAFRSELRAYGSLRRGGLKGGADGSVDFYQDCVVAHLGQAKRALVAREKGRDVELSYDSLHARSGGLLAAWRERGVLPGQRVCLLLKPGVDYAVALMTALRLGLTVCALPPGRATFARNRLEALGPDAVVADEQGLAAARSLGLTTLPLRAAQEAAGERSQTYAADAPVLCAFSPFGAGGLEPLELSAGALHAGLLRDALLVFALQSGDTLAMPGFDELVCQPTALLTTLLSGATWAELSARDLREDGDALARQGVSLLGVTAELREQLLALGSWPKGSLRAWFRALTDSLDMARWDRFTSLAVAAGVPGFNIVQAASAGGVVLFGAPFKEGPGLHVWPPPGQPFQLSEVAADALPALTTSGVYYPLVDDELVEGAPRMYLTAAAHGYLCVGSLDVGPSAMSYPIDEVSLLAQAQPGVEYASVVVTAGSVVNTAQVTLLVFVDRAEPEAESSVVSPAKLSALIAREFGEAFAPSRVEVVPLRPRVTEGVLDRAWCRSQYLSGALRTKARREIFLQLSRLSYLLDVPESSGDGRDGGIA